MTNLTDVFSNFFSLFKNNSKKKSNDSLQFAKLLNGELINDLQLSISDYARNHIKNFDLDQDYYKLKKLHSKNNLFEDNKFPNKDSSVFLSVEYKEYLKSLNRMSHDGHVIWRRAKHMSKNATMAVDVNGARSASVMNVGGMSSISPSLRRRIASAGRIHSSSWISPPSAVSVSVGAGPVKK
jgi:calcineurin-like phosphoesterase family protein